MVNPIPYFFPLCVALAAVLLVYEAYAYFTKHAPTLSELAHQHAYVKWLIRPRHRPLLGLVGDPHGNAQMRLRRADCGHYIPEQVQPAGTEHSPLGDREVYLCANCMAQASQQLPLETKQVRKSGRMTATKN